MSLPIAIGGKALSSKLVVRPAPQDEYAEDGALLQASVIDTGPAVVICTTRELQATLSISYHDLNRRDDGRREGSTAEIRVQISPVGDAYSSSFRELLHRMPLPGSGNEDDDDEAKTPDCAPMTPCAVFAADGRHLACTVPYPRGDSRSVVIVFQLRRPRALAHGDELPKPSYISNEGARGLAPTIPVATNPMLVTVPSDTGAPLWTTSCLCDLSTQLQSRKYSVLVAGGVDGSLQIISYQTAKVARVSYRTTQESSPIVFMSHESFAQPTDREHRGKLVMINQDGRATVFDSLCSQEDTMQGSFAAIANASLGSMNDDSQCNLYDDKAPHEDILSVPREAIALTTKNTSSSKDNSTLFIVLHKLLQLEGSYVAGEWVDSRLLALINTPKKSNEIVAQVLTLDHQQRVTLLSKLAMVPSQLEESAHSSFALASASEIEHQRFHQVRGMTSLDFDIQTGCLAVSSFLVLKSDVIQPFSCVWNWRTNTVGLTIKSRSRVVVTHSVSGVLLASQLAMAQLKFCSGVGGGRKLVHWSSLLDSSWESHHRIRKGVYDVATLSPPDTINQPRNEFRLSSPLIMGSKSVAFPVYYNTLSRPNGEIEWREARIPSSYISSFGSPQIAAIGRNQCRSIAVAATKGFCILDCSRVTSAANVPQSHCLDGEARSKVFSANLKSGRTAHPKWSLFGSESEERGFRVITMAWWEGRPCEGDDSVGKDADDLLLVVIEREVKGRRKLHLACWSRRRLGFDHQLIRSIFTGDRSSARFGIELPEGFSPSSISILPDSLSTETYAKRRATLLLASCCGDAAVSYNFYQLQLSEFSALKGESELCTVSCALAACGILDDEHSFCNSSIFLASSSFNFDLICPEKATNMDVYHSLCTLGIIKYPGNGIRGASISPGGVSLFANLKPLVDVSYFFLSDVIATDKGAIFIWAFELTDGTMICWSVSSYDDPQLETASRMSQDGNYALRTTSFEPPYQIKINNESNNYMGSIAAVGNSTMWMQDSSNQNRPDVLIGSVPGNIHGCTMRVGQGSKALYRMVPGDFDNSVFASSFLDHDVLCPSDTVLTTPTFAVALVNFLLGKAHTHAKNGRCTNEPHFSKIFQHYALATDTIQCEDPLLTTMRILIFRFVEMLATNSVNGKNVKMVLAKSLYSNVTILARESLSDVNFAILLVGLGRQIEPSCLPYLFPVPAKHKTSSEGDSVDDLLEVMLGRGSLSSALSALPLLPSKSLSLEMCKCLLHHCFQRLMSALSTSSTINFDDSTAERAGLVSLSRFGMQLEDIDDCDVWEEAVRELAPIIVPAVDNGDIQPKKKKVTPKRGQTTKSSVSFFSGLYCRGRRSKQVESDVSEAASAFVTAGFEEGDYDFMASDADFGMTARTEKVKNTSIAGVLAQFFFSSLAVTADNKWKRLSLVGQILLGDGSTTLIDLLPPDTTDFMNAADAASLNDLSSALEPWLTQADDASLDSADLEKDIVDFFLANFLSCEHEVSSKQAGQLLDVVLLIMSRLPKERSGANIKHGLLLIGVVAGHVSGRIDDVFDSSTQCPLYACYRIAENDSEGTL